MRAVLSARAPKAVRILAALSAPVFIYFLPQPVLAHQLNQRYEAPLPLVAYIGAAGLAVAMSFLFVMLRNPTPQSTADQATEERGDSREVPRWLRYGLQGLGLLAWIWIVVQTVGGGSGDADVASLFLWVYGWVGVALISALIWPIWAWLNPFSTISQLFSAAAGRLGLSSGEPAVYPEWLGRWPAAVGFIAVVWLELVLRISGGQALGFFLIAYTFVSVAAMALFGRETWRAQGETFSVWFSLLNRLAPFAVDGEPEDGRVVRRAFASGLMNAPWMLDELVLVALATGAIIFDGLSQTQFYFDQVIARSPIGDPVVRDTITCILFLGAITLIVLIVARVLSVRAVAAGLLPVAVGYLIAHYLTFLTIDGQRIIAALNDPLMRGDNLLPGNLGFWQPAAFIPTSIVWTIQLGAVIGGHILGAWSGHTVLWRDRGRAPAVQQLPLAVMMVCLTALTLWSLGQDVLVTTPASG
jgi:hypothetical protein